MRIRVTTSINVRSNTAPTSPVQTRETIPPLPPLQDDKTIIEKVRSKSPIPFLNPRPDMSKSRFVASQRPPKGSRLSAWFHGFSAIDDNRGRSAAHHRQVSHTSTHCYSRTPRRRSRQRTQGLRPATSTRGVIDPVHSPTTATWPAPPLHHGGDDIYQATTLAELGYLPSNEPQRPIKEKSNQKQQERTCFPHVKERQIRHKIVGCLVFGTLLTIILTTYLALAISNSAVGTTFHGIFIFFILVSTIAFSHYLIRLCMLAFRPQRRIGKQGMADRVPWPSDEERLLHESQAVPIILARDEEMGSPEGQTNTTSLRGDVESERELPAPPPVYGNWRGSVRADPNLIHWQLHTNQPDAQREARELIFAGSGHRPPSYTSNEMREAIAEERSIPRPLPLFAERRRAAGVLHE